MHQNVSVVATDDMVFLVKCMLCLQVQFQEQGINSCVDIGYHYTKPENFECIQLDGLLTHSD